MQIIKQICQHAKSAKGTWPVAVRKRLVSAPLCGRRFYYNGTRTGARRVVFNTAVLLGIGGGIGVGVLYSYNYTAECKTSPQTEEAEEGGKPRGVTLEEIVDKARDVVQRVKDETGSPGLVIGVSVDGQTVWSEGLGYADVENRVRMCPETVLRIASISKPITMAAVAKQWELGNLDLDKAVQYYVPTFPEKRVNDVAVHLTTRHLVSQMGGIRHYRKDYLKKEEKKEEKTNLTKTSDKEKKKKPMDSSGGSKPESEQSEMELDEYYITKTYDSVTESLSLFKDDPLVHSPGSKFLYTTHGWTLISAVLEAVTKEPYEKHIIKMVKELGMENTFLDENSPLIYHRGRHYVRNKKGQLRNSPYVDLSYKWAGGGLLSNVPDILKFGNAMLYSYQCPNPSPNQTGNKKSTDPNPSPKQTSNKKSMDPNQNSSRKPGFLKMETMKSLWTPLCKCGKKDGVYYGMGWYVDDEIQKYGRGKQKRFCPSHSGAAVGGSSILLVLPPSTKTVDKVVDDPPKGVVVVIMVNMISVSLSQAALEVATLFEKL